MAIKFNSQGQTGWLKPRRHRASLIKVDVYDHFASKIYTTGSTISGGVTITPQTNISFDTFQIVFTGKASTQIDFIRPGASCSSHIFLKIDMPILKNQLPKSRVFEAGNTYHFPFTFVVPSQLGTAACNHDCSTFVHNQHLQLPPTMGHWDGDDQAPEAAKIEYSIGARIIQKKKSREDKVTEAILPVRVLPMFSEEPPLHILPDDKRYRMSDGNKIRPNLLSANMGALRMSANQPRPVELSASTLGARESSIRLNLDFITTSANMSPPAKCCLTAKIISMTHFSLAPINNLLHLGDSKDVLPCPVVPYLSTDKITPDHPGRIIWERKCSGALQEGSRMAYHDDNESDLKPLRDQEVQSFDNDESCGLQHTAVLDVPIKIPATKKNIFLPTFHSCLISRTYIISLTLVVGQFSTALSLSIPLQVTTTKESLQSPGVAPRQEARHQIYDYQEYNDPPLYYSTGQLVS